MYCFPGIETSFSGNFIFTASSGAGDNRLRAGASGLRAGDNGTSVGASGLRAGDNGTSAGDSRLRAGASGLHAGASGLRAGAEDPGGLAEEAGADVRVPVRQGGTLRAGTYTVYEVPGAGITL
jgi:hypothetical protein